jgi:hypothetical protein
MTKRISTALLAMFVMGAVSVHAQTTTTTTTKTKPAAKKPAKESDTEREIRELREQLAAQQAEIDSLRQQNASKDAVVSTAQQQAQTAASHAATAANQAQAAASQAAAAQQQAQSASSSSQQNTDAVNNLKTTVTTLQTTNAGLAQTISDTKKDLTDAIESPLAIHYKGVTITPVAFAAAESVFRTRATNSDINTPFNSIPYMNSGQAYTSEFNGSGRQSRLGLRITSKVPWGTMTGYYEMDFLGTGVTSNNNQSNSYVLRQRQIFAQAAVNNGFTFTGGSLWSLVTETKHGVDPTTENLPQVVDPQYHVGFDWTRQYGARFAQTFAGGKAVAAISIEEPQIVNYTSSTTPPDFFVGNIGTGGGLYNLTNKYTNNTVPDVVVKFAFDPGPGLGHYEIGGLVRTFRSRIYPNQTSTVSSAVGAYNDNEVGGGAFLNIRFPMSKYADIGLHMMGGDGVNRYGSSQLADVTVRYDGKLEPLRGAQGLFSLELHPTKKLDLMGYAGSEYAQRTYYIVNGTVYGYAPPTISTAGCFAETATSNPGTASPPTTGTVFGGAPYDPSSSCGAQTRVITEGTGGFVYRFFNSPTKGRIQFQMDYSYFVKTAWTGTNGGPKATDNMVFTGFRYYIP